ncbi:MAG: NFACT family protein, partial [Nitrososphaerota archaeon]
MNLSSLDILVLLKEIKSKIIGFNIKNVYHLNDIVLLKISSKEYKFELFLIPGNCIFYTEEEVKKPATPSNLAKRLRKFINNGIINSIEQVNFERIIKFTINNRGKKYFLYLELFPRGNLILVDENEEIQCAFYYKKMRDRNILIGSKYSPPPLKQSITYTPSLEEMEKILSSKDKVVSILAKYFGGKYSEEILYRANVDKNKIALNISNEELLKIIEKINEILNELNNPNPQLIIKNGEAIPIPIKFNIFQNKNYSLKFFKSFNDAIKEAWKYEIEMKQKYTFEKEISEKKALIEKEIKDKEKAIETLSEKALKNRFLAKKLFIILNEIENARKEAETLLLKNENEENIIEKCFKKFSNEEIKIFGIKKDTKEIVFSTPYGDISLSIKEPISKQLNKLFEEAKEYEKEKNELLKRINELKIEIEKLISKTLIREEKIEMKPAIKESWLNKFRWSYTSNGKLIISGKDIGTNNLLYKKYMENSDLVFHADIKGAPLTILKSGKECTNEEIIEAAQFSASWSKAWKENIHSM